jgi:uncharacterized protein (DUF1697 family)
MAGDRHVALLRGINVGGKNKLPMRDLTRYFEDAGGKAVRTYIQSGNVVFDAPAKSVERVARAVEARIEEEKSIRVPLVVRAAALFARAAKENPFLARGADPNSLHVSFLAAAPTTAQIASLDPLRSAPDLFEVIGSEIYLLLPNGVGKSKLTNAYFDSKLKTTSTIRNWRTVLALVALAATSE